MSAPPTGDPTRPGPGRSLRVATFNIRHGAGLDGRVDLERVARVIAGTGAHVVGLQEWTATSTNAAGSSTPEERRVQARALLEHVRRDDGPAVVLGDLNAGPQAREITILTSELVDCWACGAREPATPGMPGRRTPASTTCW